MRKVLFAIMFTALALSAGLGVRAQISQQVGTWAPGGSSPDNRIGAAAVALADGRTLIVGGAIDGVATDAVVIYNPTDRSFSSAGRLLSARTGHTATLLEDGRVLIAGGTVNEVLSGDLEVFDVSASTSTLVATMAELRSGHSAARLPDGRVLIAGGTGTAGVLRSAEVFDPSAGTSSLMSSSMQSARTGASATTLIDGRVLIAGGNDGNRDLASAEVFYAVTQYFEATDTTLSAPRRGHSATLLPNNSAVLIAGGSSNGEAKTSADLFLPVEFPDPYSYGMGRFASTGAMATARVGAIGLAGLEGYALAIGGGSRDAESYRFATVKTDKDDYAPGTKAIITGSGWQPGEQVRLLFQEDPAVHDDYVLTTTADAEGRIYYGEWAPEEHDLGVRFFLMASGQQSGRLAQTTFTDSINVTVDNPGAVVWHRTGEVPGGFNVSASGTYTCNTSGSAGNSCTSVTNLTITVSGSTGSKSITGLGNNVTNAGWGPVVLEFRTSPGVGQFSIPADGRPDVTATLNTNAPNSPSIATENNHFGVDNTAPITSLQCNGGACVNPYSVAVSVALTATDGSGSNNSGLASTQYCIDETNTCVPGTTYTAGFSVPFASGVTKFVRYRRTDTAGNIESTKSQSIVFQATTFNVTFDAPSIADVPAATTVLSVTVGAGPAVSVPRSDLPKTFTGIASGTNVSYSYLSPLTVSTTKQYRWLSTAGTGSAAGQTTQAGGPFSVTANSSVTATYKAQHLLTFNLVGVDVPADYTGTVVTIGGVSIPSTSFVGNSHTQWVDDGAAAPSVSWTDPLTSSVAGKQYDFLNATPASLTTPVTAAQTVTANYQKQWRLTFNLSGVDGDYTGQVANIGGTPISSAQFVAGTYTQWVNAGSPAPSVSWTDPLLSSVAGKQYAFVSASPTSLTTPVNAPETMTATYQKQWRLTFTLSGVDADFTGTVFTIDGTTAISSASFVGTSYTRWVNHNSAPVVAWEDPLASTEAGKRYDFLSATSLGTPVTAPQALTATYKKQWQLTFTLSGVDPDYTGQVAVIVTPISSAQFAGGSYTQWVDDGSAAPTVSWSDPLASTFAGKQYDFVNSTPGALTSPVSAAQTMTANYQKQWRLTFTLSGVDPDYTGQVATIGGTAISSAQFAGGSYMEWVNDGSTAPTVSWTPTLLSSTAGKQYVFVSAAPTTLATPVTAAETMTATYQKQWQITFTLAGVDADYTGTVLTLDSTTAISSASFVGNSYSRWVNHNSALTVTWEDPLASTQAGKRYDFLSATPLTTPVIAPQTLTANYQKQWLLTLNLSGVDADYTGTVVTIGASAVLNTAFSGNSYATWVNHGSSPTLAWQDPLASTVAGKRYDFLNTAPAYVVPVNAPQTLTASYNTQWLVTWAQTGLAGTGSHRVVTVNGSPYALASPLFFEWFNDGASINYAFEPLISTDPASSVQFELTNGGSLPTSPIAVSGAMTITGTYSPNTYTIQYLSPLDQSEGSNYRVNSGKNGRVVPVKVLLFKNGVAISDTSTVLMKVSGSNCEAGTGAEPIDEYADAGASSGNSSLFRWSAPHWIYNLDTRAVGMATNACYRLDVYINAVTGSSAIKASASRWAIFKPVK